MFYTYMQRCQGTTQKGEQCRRLILQGNCAQHSTLTSCPVCFSQLTEGTSRTLPCSHVFHTRCIDRWKRTSSTCPMCRAPFDQPKYKISLSIHHLASDRTVRDSYITSNVSQIFQTFGIPMLQPRFITDVFFDIGLDEFIEDVFQEIGIRLPGHFHELVQEQSDQPQP